MTNVARAIAALKAGRAVGIDDLAVASVETASDDYLAESDPDGLAGVILSGQRAAALGLGNQRDAASPDLPVLIERLPWMTAGVVRRMADPADDFSRVSGGPVRALAMPDEWLAPAAAAIELARMAGLLPALWRIDTAPALKLKSSEATAASRARSVVIAARASLPLEGIAADVQVVAMRAEEDGAEHAALLIGAPGGGLPLVRIHSECLTGDIFGSLKCDCGPQLREALRLMAEGGGGILLYLRQEGRGIGLANKIRAYALQDRGLDTVDSNRRLGFPDDARDYGLAAAMLRALGVDGVRLLTNNPAKVAGLENEGVRVTRVAHHLPANPHNSDYLRTKRVRSGHLS